jgi:hypothetical protein
MKRIAAKTKPIRITAKAIVLAYLDQKSPGWRRGIKLSEKVTRAVKAVKAEWKVNGKRSVKPGQLIPAA